MLVRDHTNFPLFSGLEMRKLPFGMLNFQYDVVPLCGDFCVVHHFLAVHKHSGL